MSIRVLVIFGFILLSTASCQEQKSIDVAEATVITYEKLSVATFTKEIDISQLPPPALEQQGEKVILDFKDYKQNAWIVVIVHPDGFTEISFDEIGVGE